MYFPFYFKHIKIFLFTKRLLEHPSLCMAWNTFSQFIQSLIFFITTNLTVQFGYLRLEIYILLYAFYQSFKVTRHVKLIPVTCRFLLLSELPFATALLFIIYLLIYSPLYSRKDTHRKGLLKDCFHLICITSCIYLLLSLLNCIYETFVLLV